MPEASTLAAGQARNVRTCTVQLLDDVAIQVEFNKADLGSVVIEKVCNHLSLAERDYFGLHFTDQNLHRYWLDPSKPVLKQVKAASSLVFAFRVKFYPADPTILKEEYTRYLLVLQLRRDLLHGRLHCPQNDLAALAAFVVQGELGDFDPTEHTGNYVSQFKILINQSPKLEEKIVQAHKALKGQTPAEVDTNFLKKATTLENYGYYPYTIKDSKAGQVFMSASPRGISIYQTSRKLHDIPWDSVDNLDYSGKEFYIFPKRSYFDEHGIVQDAPINADAENSTKNSSHVTDLDQSNERPTSVASSAKSINLNKPSKKKLHIKLLCPNSSYSKQIWKCMLAQKAFFTSSKADQVKPIVKRHLLFRNATFRWNPANKVLEELKSLQSPPRLKCPTFERLKIPRQANRDDRNGPWANKFHTMPSRAKILAPLDSTDAPAPPAPKISIEAPELGSLALGIRPTILQYNGALPALPPSPDSGVVGDHPSPVVASSTTSRPAAPSAATSSVAALLTSTPKRPMESVVKRAVLTDDGSKSAKPQNASNVFAKSCATLPSPPAAKSSPSAAGSSLSMWPSARRRAASCSRLLFLSLLVCIAAAALIAGAMEWRDPRWRSFIDSQPLVDNFRHKIYEPTRLYLCDKSARLF